jgi:glucosamine-6-phosphate deaminase
MSTIAVGKGLSVRGFSTRGEIGEAAAADIAQALRDLLDAQEQVRMLFASAPSQHEMQQALLIQPGVDWTRVVAFHLDEYIGLPSGAPQRFGESLSKALFQRLPFAAVHLIEPTGDPALAAERYAKLLSAAPIDIVCLGVGVNGHLAFNDPPEANFTDPLAVKVVRLEPVARRQQVDDGCFESLDAVPTHAITVTIPTIISAHKIFCVVPGQQKRDAISQVLAGPISRACPGTVLRLHPDCRLYLDSESSPDGSYERSPPACGV